MFIQYRQSSKEITINKRNTLDVLKQCFEQIIPSQDGRTPINPLSFVVCLVFCYLGDSKTFSLEAIRRFMKSQLNTGISRSAFWERLARDRLKNYLGQVVAKLMVILTTSTLRGNSIGSIWVPVSSIGYVSNSSKRGLSSPLPRRRTLCTNWKKPK